MHIRKELLEDAPIIELEPNTYDIPNYTKAMMWLNRYANTAHYTRLKEAFDRCYFDRELIKLGK